MSPDIHTLSNLSIRKRVIIFCRKEISVMTYAPPHHSQFKEVERIGRWKRSNHIYWKFFHVRIFFVVDRLHSIPKSVISSRSTCDFWIVHTFCCSRFRSFDHAFLTTKSMVEVNCTFKNDQIQMNT